MAHDLSNPILNSPYCPPEQHFELGDSGPTGEVLPGRRPSESFIPIPVSRKGGKGSADAMTLDFDVTGERREQNTLINDIRREVERWRASNWNGVTPIHPQAAAALGRSDREDRVLFCQREAAETAIFLAEVAGRHGTADYRRRLEPENAVHNDGLPRVGAEDGDRHRQDRRDGDADRLADRQQGACAARRPLREAVPRRHARHHDPRPAPRAAARAMRTTTTASATSIPPDLGRRSSTGADRDHNYHTFLLKDAKEIKGVAANTRKLLRGASRKARPVPETPQAMVAPGPARPRRRTRARSSSSTTRHTTATRTSRSSSRRER